MIKIYTDGSCQPNPGIGGWAYIIVSNWEEVGRASGQSIANTTNNRMELLAVIKALETLPSGDYEVVSDSKYIIQTLNQGWKINANPDLWIELDRLSRGKNILWTHIRGHGDDKWNALVDLLESAEVVRAATREFIPLYREVLEKLGD